MAEVLKRSQEPFYSYEPYYNRRGGEKGWQWKFLAAAGDYKGRIALGGNRIGKSDQGAYESWLAISGLHPYRKFPASGKGWIVGLNFNMVRDINLPKFEKFMPSSYRLNSTFNKQDKIWWIEGEGRSWKIQFKSADSGRRIFQADDVDWIWFDEEMPEEIWAECMQRLIDRRGIWWMTATPIMGTAWLKAKTQEEGIFTTYGAMWDNPYLPQEEIELNAKNLSEEERKVRVEGKYIIFGGKPVFDVLSLTRLLGELDEKHPTGLKGTLTECAA
jgi:phage terminase large subunit-like protein